MTRKPYHHGDVRTQALQGAIELTRQSHLLGWSLRELAKQIGVSHVALYNHFSNKDDLLYALATTGFEQLIEKSRSRSEFAEMGKVYINYAVKNPEIFEAMFHPQLPPSGNSAFAAAASRYIECVRASIDDEQNRDAVFLKGWAAVHGYAQLYARGVIQNAGLPKTVYRADAFIRFLWQ